MLIIVVLYGISDLNMNMKKIYIIGICIALLGSFFIDSVLTCVMIASVLFFIPLCNEGMDVNEYYRDYYSLDEFDDELLYQVFCKAAFILSTTFMYSVCSN